MTTGTGSVGISAADVWSIADGLFSNPVLRKTLELNIRKTLCHGESFFFNDVGIGYLLNSLLKSEVSFSITNADHI